MRKIRGPTTSADFKRKQRRRMVSNKQNKSEKEIKVMAKSKDFSYEIVKAFGTLGEDSKKELNIISYNGNEAKLDIREWFEKDGEKKMGKGVALTKDEFKALIELGVNYLKEDEEDDDIDF